MSNLFGRSREPNRYEPMEVLGHGAYGKVFKAKDTENGTYIAMKKMNINLEREGVPTTTLREVALLKELIHPYIVRLHDVVVTELKLYLIFEYLDKDLRKVLDESVLTAEQIRKIMSQILEALAFCHSRRFMHRDLKPENVLVDSELNVKLADFGLARAYQIPNKPYTSEVQTLWYRAPEVLLGSEQYSISIDIWSVGCIFAELIRCQALFHGASPYNQIIEIFKLLGTPREEDWQGVTTLKNFPVNHEQYPAVPFEQTFHGLERNAIDLMQQMLTINPNKRISAKAALNHPYFTGAN
jgi:serine/threonine protein kinase